MEDRDLFLLASIQMFVEQHTFSRGGESPDRSIFYSTLTITSTKKMTGCRLISCRSLTAVSRSTRTICIFARTFSAAGNALFPHLNSLESQNKPTKDVNVPLGVVQTRSQAFFGKPFSIISREFHGTSNREDLLATATMPGTVKPDSQATKGHKYKTKLKRKKSPRDVLNNMHELCREGNGVMWVSEHSGFLLRGDGFPRKIRDLLKKYPHEFQIKGKLILSVKHGGEVLDAIHNFSTEDLGLLETAVEKCQDTDGWAQATDILLEFNALKSPGKSFKFAEFVWYLKDIPESARFNVGLKNRSFVRSCRMHEQVGETHSSTALEELGQELSLADLDSIHIAVEKCKKSDGWSSVYDVKKEIEASSGLVFRNIWEVLQKASSEFQVRSEKYTMVKNIPGKQ